MAAHILDKVEKRYADKLSDGQWYRIKAIRATLRMREGEWERAGTILLDAKRHQPATERARVNEALAYELLGDKGKAHELATALRTEFSHASRPLAIWLRTAPEATPYSDLEAEGGSLPEEEEAFSEKTSIFFKKTRIYRIPDLKRNAIVYLAISSKIIDGSPANAVSAVPVMPWPAP